MTNNNIIRACKYLSVFLEKFILLLPSCVLLIIFNDYFNLRFTRSQFIILSITRVGYYGTRIDDKLRININICFPVLNYIRKTKKTANN